MRFESITLEGKNIRLEPLYGPSHEPGLTRIIQEGELWKIFFTAVPRPEHIDAFFDDAQVLFESGRGLAFAIIDQKTDQIAGSTRFTNTSFENKRVEIGFTFLGPSFQQTAMNTEAKFLMLRYVFEELNLNRVEFIADYLNAKSRKAILRLGAKEEGLMRQHIVMKNGRVRDSMLYSIIKYEWESVKQNLLYKLS